MDSANTVSDLQAKPPDFAATILSSLSADIASGNPLDKMFSDLLSRVQEPAPPAPPPNTPVANASTPASAPPPQQSPPAQQNASSDESDDASQTDNASNSNTTANTSANDAPKTPPGWTQTGKLHRHEAKSDTGSKGKSHKADHGANASAATSATAGSQIPAAAALKDNGDGTDANFAAAADTDPGVDSVLNASQDAGAQNTAPATDTDSTADTSAADDSGNTASNDGDVTIPELMILLSQLEQFAARQLTDTASGPAASANAATPQDAGATTAASTAAGTKTPSSGKNSLAALLASLGRFDESTNGADATGQNGDNQANAGSNTAPAATAASLQNTVSQATGAPAAKAANNGWQASFFSLFNAASANQGDITASLASAFTAGAAPPTTSGGDDGASLDMDAQGQNNASPNASAMSSGDNMLASVAAGTPPPASPYDFASQLSAMRLAKGGDAGLPVPVEQVVLQMSRAARDGSSQMTIQLRPAELGRVDVKLNIGADGKVQGTVTADNPTTLGLLLKDVRSLERALQEAGLRADSGSLQFNLRGDGQTGGGSGQTAGQSNTNDSGGVQTGVSTSVPVAADAGEIYYLTPGGVNMRV